MYINRRKTTITILAIVAVFLLGYYHSEVDALFINERSLIGLLFVVILIMALAIIYLKYEILRQKYRREQEEGDREELRHENYKLRNELSSLKRKK